METADVLLTVIYISYIVAPLLSDELWLRIALAITSVGFVIWGALIDSEITMIANALFFTMSMYQVVKLIRARQPVELTLDQDLVHQSIFPSMSSRQFILFWHLGEEFIASPGEALIRKDTDIDHLFIVVDGEAEVVLPSGNRRFGPPSMFGEMSFIRGHEATTSADVVTVGEVRGRRWDQARLYALNETHPQLTEPFLRSLGADLAHKVG